jgi:hypothetical protein
MKTQLLGSPEFQMSFSNQIFATELFFVAFTSMEAYLLVTHKLEYRHSKNQSSSHKDYSRIALD